MLRFTQRDFNGTRLRNNHPEVYLKTLLRFSRSVGLVHYDFDSNRNMLTDNDTVPLLRIYHMLATITIYFVLSLSFATLILFFNYAVDAVDEAKSLQFALDVVDRACTFIATILLHGIIFRKWRYFMDAVNALLRLRQQCRSTTRCESVVTYSWNYLTMARWLLIVVRFQTGYDEQKLRLFLLVFHAVVHEFIFQAFVFYTLNLARQQQQLNDTFRLTRNPADIRQLAELFTALEHEHVRLNGHMRPFLYAHYLQIVSYLIGCYGFLKCGLFRMDHVDVLVLSRLFARIVPIADILVIAAIGRQFKRNHSDFRDCLYMLFLCPWKTLTFKNNRDLVLKLLSMFTFNKLILQNVGCFDFKPLTNRYLNAFLFKLVYTTVVALMFLRFHRTYSTSPTECVYEIYGYVNQTEVDIYNITFDQELMDSLDMLVL